MSLLIDKPISGGSGVHQHEASFAISDHSGLGQFWMPNKGMLTDDWLEIDTGTRQEIAAVAIHGRYLIRFIYVREMVFVIAKKGQKPI